MVPRNTAVYSKCIMTSFTPKRVGCHVKSFHQSPRSSIGKGVGAGTSREGQFYFLV